MVKNVTEIKKLLQDGIRQAIEEGHLPENFKRRVIPLGKLIIILNIYLITNFNLFIDNATRWNSTYK